MFTTCVTILERNCCWAHVSSYKPVILQVCGCGNTCPCSDGCYKNICQNTGQPNKSATTWLAHTFGKWLFFCSLVSKFNSYERPSSPAILQWPTVNRKRNHTLSLCWSPTMNCSCKWSKPIIVVLCCVISWSTNELFSELGILSLVTYMYNLPKIYIPNDQISKLSSI